MIDIHHSMIDIMTNIRLRAMVWLVVTAIGLVGAEAVEEGIEAVHRHQVRTIVTTIETEIIGEVVEEARARLTITSTAIVVVGVGPAVRPLLVVGEDGVNQWTMSTTLTVAVMEVGAIIIEGNDPDHILPPPPPPLPHPFHLRHPVPPVASVIADVDRRGADVEDPLLMIVLLVEEVVEAVEVVEIIEVATIVVETILVPVAEGEEEVVPLLHVLVPDREKAQNERATAVAVVETATTAALADVSETEEKGRHRKKKEPNIQSPRLLGIVQKA